MANADEVAGSESSSSSEQVRESLVAVASARCEPEDSSSSSSEEHVVVHRKKRSSSGTRHASKKKKKKPGTNAVGGVLATASAYRKEGDNDGSKEDSCDDYNDDKPVKKKRKYTKRKQAKKPRVQQTYGDYVLQFQDDQTGFRQLHPSAMRYCLKVLQEEADRTTQSVSQSLAEKGEVAESRKVRQKSSDNVDEIVSRVRRRLGNTLIPARYVKIEDLIAVDLEQTNGQRQEEIEENRAIAKQLEQQRKLLQKDYDEAKARRDDFQMQLDALNPENENSGTAVHPLLQDRSASASTSTSFSVPLANTLASVPKDAMTKLLNNVQSPYDL